jgi:hypothetical protein
MMRKLGHYATLAVFMLLPAAAAHAAAPVSAPEIGPASVTTGLALLTGSILILRSLRR